MSEQKIMTLESQQYYDGKIKFHMNSEMLTHNNSDSAHEDIRLLVEDLDSNKADKVEIDGINAAVAQKSQIQIITWGADD